MKNNIKNLRKDILSKAKEFSTNSDIKIYTNKIKDEYKNYIDEIVNNQNIYK